MGRHDDRRPEHYAWMPDEELLVRARKDQDRYAEDELLDRHFEWITRVVCRVARRRHLPWSAWEDAQQVGHYAIRQAIAAGRPAGPGAARGGRFPPFLARVVERRVRDFARRQRRQELPRDPPADDNVEAGLEDGELVDPAAADPARLALQHEGVELLLHLLDSLGPVERQLVETLVSRDSVKAVARKAKLRYTAAKEKRRRILLRLRRALGDAGE